MARQGQRTTGTWPLDASAAPGEPQGRAGDGKYSAIGIGDSDQRHLLYLAAQCLTQIRIARGPS